MRKYVFHQRGLFILQLFLLKRLLDRQPRSNEVRSAQKKLTSFPSDARSPWVTITWIHELTWERECFSSPSRWLEKFLYNMLRSDLFEGYLLLIKLVDRRQSHRVTIAKSDSTRQVFNLVLPSCLWKSLHGSSQSLKLLPDIVHLGIQNRSFFGLTDHHITTCLTLSGKCGLHLTVTATHQIWKWKETGFKHDLVSVEPKLYGAKQIRVPALTGQLSEYNMPYENLWLLEIWFLFSCPAPKYHSICFW